MTCEVTANIDGLVDAVTANTAQLALIVTAIGNVSTNLSSAGAGLALNGLSTQFNAFAINIQPMFNSFSALGLSLNVIPGVGEIATKLDAIDATLQIVKDRIGNVSDEVSFVVGKLDTTNLRLYDIGSTASNAVTQLGAIADQAEIIGVRVAGPGDTVAGEIDQAKTALQGAINTQVGAAVTQLTAIAGDIVAGVAALVAGMEFKIGDRISPPGGGSVAGVLSQLDATIIDGALAVSDALAPPGDSIAAGLDSLTSQLETELGLVRAAIRTPGAPDIGAALASVQGALDNLADFAAEISDELTQGLLLVADRLAAPTKSVAAELALIAHDTNQLQEDSDRLADTGEANALVWNPLAPILKREIVNIERCFEYGLFKTITHDSEGLVTGGQAWLDECNETLFRFIFTSTRLSIFGGNGIKLEAYTTGPPQWID